MIALPLSSRAGLIEFVLCDSTGSFRLWCATANRAIEQSGVPADEVEERVRLNYRPTTPIFRRNGWMERPMSVPTWQVCPPPLLAPPPPKAPAWGTVRATRGGLTREGAMRANNVKLQI